LSAATLGWAGAAKDVVVFGPREKIESGSTPAAAKPKAKGNAADGCTVATNRAPMPP